MLIRRSVLSLVAAAGLPSAALAQLDEDFDGYVTGTTIAGQGGWEGWYSGFVDATVSSAQANSAPNSLELAVLSDIVYRFNITSGQWVARAMTYMPSSAPGDGTVWTPGGLGENYFIIMNQYRNQPDPNDPFFLVDSWSCQIGWDIDSLLVFSDFDDATLPMIRDQWVELRVEIDLDADSYDIYYGGQVLAQDLIWTSNVSVGGILAIQSFDLFSNSGTQFFYDDVSLQPASAGCPADLTGSSDPNDPSYGVPDGVLDGSDFFYYLDQFVGGNLAEADLTTSSDPNDPGYGVPDGVLDGSDFFYYLDTFVAGCP